MSYAPIYTCDSSVIAGGEYVQMSEGTTLLAESAGIVLATWLNFKSDLCTEESKSQWFLNASITFEEFISVFKMLLCL